MKSLLLLSILLLVACNINQEPETLVRSVDYPMRQANYNPVYGNVKVSELAPGKLEISILVENTSKNLTHPAHLHFGSISEVGELAFRLNPIDGSTGTSVTILDQAQLSNGEILTYDSFLSMNGSIKIHMDELYFKNMVLSYANVGSNQDYFFDGVAVCTGH
tara:strand:- start:6381 stop:6866 length:486 start_codon:yes stop_codon:yes gene_type:complete